MNNTYGERLAAALRSSGKSRLALSDAVGVSVQAIGSVVNGYTKAMTAENNAKAAAFLGCDPNWLATGKGSMAAAMEPVATYGESAPSEDEFALVPQLDISAACGDGKFVEHVVVKGGLAFKKSSLRDFGVPEGAARVIYASGGSMEPTIQDGCVVLLNTADTEPRDGRVYAICQPDGSIVLKRLVWDYSPALGSQGWIMRSDNHNKTLHPDKTLPPDSRTMIVGRAVWNDNRL